MKKIICALTLGASLFAGDLVVENPYVKITPPTAKNTAVFMQIKNNSDKDIKLIDAKSDFPKVTEIHTHIHEDGMMKMVKIQDATIPANGMLELKPKSYHVMLIDIPNGIDKDSKVNVELFFDNGEKVELKDIPSKEVIHKHH